MSAARTAKPNPRARRQAGLRRRVGEVTVPVVAEIVIGRALQAEGAERHHLDAFPWSVRFAFRTSSIDASMYEAM